MATLPREPPSDIISAAPAPMAAQAPSKPLQLVPFVCVSCKRNKRLCARRFPCERCFRLGQQCRPPPVYLAHVAAAAAVAAVVDPTPTPSPAPLSSASASSPSSSSEDESMQRQQQKERENGDQQHQFTGTLRLFDLSIRTGKPAEWAEGFIAVFQERFDQGEICRWRTVKMLRAWREQSRQARKDVTVGIADAAANAFNISPWEIEAAEESKWDNRAGLPSVHVEKERGHGVLRKSKLFEYATTMFGERDDACFHISCPVQQSVLLISSATSPSADLWSSHDIHAMMGAHQLLVTLLFAGCVAEGDRRAWFELFVDCFFGKGLKTCSRLIKTMDRKGEIRVYLFKARSVYCEEVGDNVMLTCVERAPSSRHLSEFPNHPHKIVNRLRVDKGSSSFSSSSSSVNVKRTASSSSSSSSSAAPASSGLPSFFVKGEVFDHRSQWEGDEKEGRERLPPQAPWLEGEVGAALKKSMLHEVDGDEQHHCVNEQQQEQEQQQQAAIPGLATIPDPRPWMWCKTLVERGEEDVEQQEEQEESEEEKGRRQGAGEEGEEEDKWHRQALEETRVSPPILSLNSHSAFSYFPPPTRSHWSSVPPTRSSPSSHWSSIPPPFSSSSPSVPYSSKEEEKQEIMIGGAEGGNGRRSGRDGRGRNNSNSKGHVVDEPLVSSSGGRLGAVPVLDQGVLDVVFE